MNWVRDEILRNMSDPEFAGAYLEGQRERIAELEAALRDVVSAWYQGKVGGREPLVDAIDRAEMALKKSEKR